MRIIHCLLEGRALCGKAGVPGGWPEGHVWLSIEEWHTHEMVEDAIKCQGCDVAVQLRKRTFRSQAKSIVVDGGAASTSIERPANVAVEFTRFVRDKISGIAPAVQEKLIALFKLGSCQTCEHWQGGKYDLQARCDIIRISGHVICLEHEKRQPMLFVSCWFGCRNHRPKERDSG
jgi:hypothetical protein